MRLRNVIARRYAVLAVVCVAACSRGVAVESEPGPVYTVSVENPMPHPMIVMYDDGVEARDLGSVPAHDTREFVIAAPADRTVDIVAHDQGKTHTVTKRVTLQAGSAVHVALTP